MKANWRVVIFREGDVWVAQCLEYDISTHAKTIAELKTSFARVARRYAELAIRLGEEPFARMRPAPKRFHEMYQRGAKLMETLSIRLPEHRKATPARLAIAA